MKYTVKVTETTIWNISIEADSPDEAEYEASELYGGNINWHKDRLHDLDMAIGGVEYEVVE
jgi:hypothetical protein